MRNKISNEVRNCRVGIAMTKTDLKALNSLAKKLKESK